MSARDPRFHVYPMEDLLGVRRTAARLDRLEAGAVAELRPFLAERRVALALSFGKDSMVVLHILHAAGLLSACRIVMWNGSGLDTPDTLAMRDYVVERYRLTRYVETQPDPDVLRASLAKVDVGAHHPTRDFVYECLEKPRWRTLDEYEIDGVVLGLRAAESRGRALNTASRGTRYWNRREKAEILTPIVRWSTDDIFHYIALRDVALHPIYHRMPALGFDRHFVRLASPVDLTAATRGQIFALRRLYPSTFRRYAEIVPDIRTFT